MIDYSVKLDNRSLVDTITAITDRYSRMKPVFSAIGETVAESTKRRFTTSTAPDGSRWAPLAQTTVLDRLNAISGHFAAYTRLKTGKEGRIRVGDKKGFFDKKGKLAAKGISAVMSMRPLVDTGMLQDSINYQAEDYRVEIGTNRFFSEWKGGAAVFHYGRRDGKMPARPILGITPADEVTIQEILTQFLEMDFKR